MKIAVLGTGRMGNGLARRWAKAFEEVIVGSRDSAKAEALAAEIAKEIGRGIPLVAAFKNTFSALRADPSLAPQRHDVRVCGDDDKAKAAVLGRVERIGFRPLDAGRLQGARTIEQMTVLMIAMDARCKAGLTSGWRFTG